MSFRNILNASRGLYEVAGGTYSEGNDYIYPFLDWKNTPGYAALASVIGVIAAAGGHTLVMWTMFRLRVLVVSKYFNRTH
jgi:hypothetical protein